MDKETEDKLFKEYIKNYHHFEEDPEELEPLRDTLEFHQYMAHALLHEIFYKIANRIKLVKLTECLSEFVNKRGKKR